MTLSVLGLGVNHADELPMLFLDKKFTINQMSPAEKRISTQLIEFWTNFTIYGYAVTNAKILNFRISYMGDSLNNLKIQFPNFKIWNLINKFFSADHVVYLQVSTWMG